MMLVGRVANAFSHGHTTMLIRLSLDDAFLFMASYTVTGHKTRISHFLTDLPTDHDKH
jgi:hypothetical protein